MSEGDKARLFVGGLKRHVEKTELEDAFKEFGEIKDVWVAYDPPGFGFVEFVNIEDAKRAIAEMNHKEILDSVLKVELTKKPGGRGRIGGAPAVPEQKPRLFIGGLKTELEKDDLKSAFEHLGEVTDMWIAKDPPGYAFLEFASMSSAKKAIKEMDGTKQFDTTIRVEMSSGRRGGGAGGGKRGAGQGRGGRMGPYPPPRGGGRRPYYEEPYYDYPPRRYPREPFYERDPYAAPPRRDPYGPPPRRYHDPYAYSDYGYESRPPRAYARDPYAADPYAADPYARELYPSAPRDPYAADPYTTAPAAEPAI